MAFDIKGHTAKALNNLTAKIDWESMIEDDSNRLELIRLKWHTFQVEFNPKEPTLILPTLLVETLGPALRRFATLNDPSYNEIEVLIEKKDGRIYITHGWIELNNIYDLKNGGEVTLINVHPSRYVIKVKDRYGEEIQYPKKVPPFSLKLNCDMFPEQGGSEFVLTTSHLPYSHDVNNFRFSFANFFTMNDVLTSLLTFTYDSFSESILSKDTKEFYLTDDTGHLWKCTNTFVGCPYVEYKIGGSWKQYYHSRRLSAGTPVKIGAPNRGKNLFLFITLKA